MHEAFLSVLDMSLTAGFVIAAVFAARLLLKRAPKAFSYALWAIVLFRLLCPLSIDSAFSIIPPDLHNGNAIASWTDDYIGETITYHDNLPEYDTAVAHGRTPTAAGEGGRYVVTAGDGVSEPDTVADTVIPVLSRLWILGILAMLVYTAVSLIRLRRKLVGAVSLRENIYLADHIATPFVIGIIRPKIYLPSTLSECERDYIILHEQTHIRRLDHIVKLVSFLALAFHWFNPLVWLAFVLSCKDMEMSCDEAVMKKMDGDIRADYSASLLSLATGRKVFAGAPLAFGEGDTKSRIKNVMNYRKPAFWAVIAAVIVCITVAVPLLANPAKTLELPEASSVLSMDMEQFNEYQTLGAVTATDSGDIETVLSALYGARKTWRQSVNDYPAQNNYLIVRINLSGERRTLCLYSEGNVYYIEEPYVGIYRSTRDSSVAIYKIYTGSGGIISENSDDDWQPQPEYENQEDYSKALEAAEESVKTEEIAIDDKGGNEKTALAWMEAWFDMYQALPGDNMARIAQGEVDSLKISKVSKEELPKAFVFSVTFSVRPTYPIASNAFWMAGNTGNSPGRDETWGQMYREVELRLEDDGRYHFVEMGTGGVGHSGEFEPYISTSAAERAQAVLDSVVSSGTVAITLTTADGVGGGRYEAPLEYGNGRNRVSGFDSSFDWSYIKSGPSFSPGSVSSLKVESPDGGAAIQCWQGSNQVLCTLGSESFRFSAGVLGSDAVFDGTIFTYLRTWYDEAEISGLRGDIVIPDKGQSYQEIAQAWTDAYEGAMLRATAGSKYACTYVKTAASVKEDSMDSWYPEKALKTEHFYFDYSTVFVRENGQSNWLMAGNTVDYKGNDAPAGALEYFHMGPMYLTKQGWRCDGVGTGP